MDLTPASHAEQPELRAMVKELFAETQGWRSAAATSVPIAVWTAPRPRRCYGMSTPSALDRHPRAVARGEATARLRPSKPITRPLFPERVTPSCTPRRAAFTAFARRPACSATRLPRLRGRSQRAEYRCPAAAYGLDCQGRDACHRAGGVSPGDYGRIVRISLETHDRRIFVPTPHGSPSWQRGYNRRSALERINNRIDHSFGFERHFIRGGQR